MCRQAVCCAIAHRLRGEGFVEQALFDLLAAVVAGQTLAEMDVAGLAVDALPDLIGSGCFVGFALAGGG